MSIKIGKLRTPRLQQTNYLLTPSSRTPQTTSTLIGYNYLISLFHNDITFLNGDLYLGYSNIFEYCFL